MKGQEAEVDFETLKKEAVKTALNIYKISQNQKLKNFITDIHNCKNEVELYELVGIVNKSSYSGQSFSSEPKTANSLDIQAELDKVAKSDEDKCHGSFEDLSQVDWIKNKSELESKMLRENNSLKLTLALQKKRNQNIEKTQSKLTTLNEFLFLLDNCQSQESFIALSKMVEPILSKSKNKQLLKKDDREECSKLEIEDKKNKQLVINELQKVKDNILEKITANFKIFQSFFDFLREKKYLDIGEIGHFGSRVYKQVICELYPAKYFSDNSQADFDYFCIPITKNSKGIFVINPDEMAAKINFEDLLKEFNEKSPYLQINLVNEKNGKKSVNHGGKAESLNFKLVATFFEEKSADDKSEKIIKKQIEFDLNFYTQQSILKNLQWQLNLERVMLIQDKDGNFELKLNQSSCDESKIISIDEFLIKIQEFERQNFLLDFNPEAKGFLNRIINKKGIYKYLNDEEIVQIKSNLVEEFSEKLIEELNHYKKFISMEIKEGDEVGKLKKIEYESIIKGVEQDSIFSKLITKSPSLTPCAGATKVCENGLSL